MSLRVGLPILLAAAAFAVGAQGAAAPFTPNTLAGTWKGTWKNQTFGSTGPAKIVIKSLAGGTKMKFGLSLGGNVFGCSSVPAESSPAIGRGSGPNHWNAGGFMLRGASKDLGALTVTYKAATGALVGSGTNPPCQPGLSWSVKGTFSDVSFNGNVAIKLANGTTATSVIAVSHS